MLLFAAFMATLVSPSLRLRAMPARSRLLAMSESPAASKEAYAMLDVLLKRAEQGVGRGSAQARALRNRWLDLTATELVESALILGVSIGIDFDRGLELLEVAEGETTPVPARGYSALMRIGVAAERHQEVLGLLARARVQDATASGVVLSAMQSAGALGDWGAVARLSEEYAGCEYDGCLTLALGEGGASQLEMVPSTGPPQSQPVPSPRANLHLLPPTHLTPQPCPPPRQVGSPEVLAELFGESAATVDASKLTPADRLAQSLALRAHCKRGDATRAKHTLQQMRALGVPLEPQGYSDLLGLAAEGGVGKFLAFQPLDLLHPLPCYNPYRTKALHHPAMLHPLSLLRPLTRCAPRTAPVRLDALLRRRARAGAAPPHQQAQRARQRANRAAVCRPALPLRLALAVALTFAHFALLSPSSPFLPSSPPTSPRPEPEPGTSARRSALSPSSETYCSPRSPLPTTRSPSEPHPSRRQLSTCSARLAY